MCLCTEAHVPLSCTPVQRHMPLSCTPVQRHMPLSCAPVQRHMCPCTGAYSKMPKTLLLSLGFSVLALMCPCHVPLSCVFVFIQPPFIKLGCPRAHPILIHTFTHLPTLSHTFPMSCTLVQGYVPMSYALVSKVARGVGGAFHTSPHLPTPPTPPPHLPHIIYP
jgi:hypothetical protein